MYDIRFLFYMRMIKNLCIEVCSIGSISQQRKQVNHRGTSIRYVILAHQPLSASALPTQQWLFM